MIALQLLLRSAFLFFLFGASQIEALQCGSRLANPCISSWDKRYDSEASNNLVDQNPLWQQASGLRVLTFHSLDSSGNPAAPRTYNPNDAGSFMLPYQQSPRLFFWNFTVDGSRFYDHRIGFWPKAPQEFCDSAVPPGEVNVSGNGTCGENGLVVTIEQFATSTFEKDGTAQYFWRNVGWRYSGSTNAGSRVYPVGNDTLYSHRSVPNGYVFGETSILLNGDGDDGDNGEIRKTKIGGSSILSRFNNGDMYSIFNGTLVEDTSEWLRMIYAAKTEYNITDEDWPLPLSLDAAATTLSSSGCLSQTGTCPTR